jgi:hypothetical protein
MMVMPVRLVGSGVVIGHDFNAAVLHSARREELLRDALELVGAAAQDDHFQATVVIEVYVQRRTDSFAELVLDLGQPLGQIADMVIVDEGESRDGGDAAPDLGSHHLSAHEVTE